MHWLEQQLDKLRPPDTIIHLGAGLCRELEHWRASGSKRIVLVEPNPELLPDLRHRISVSDPVDIMPVAVSTQAARESLYLFNFPMLSSLRHPTALYQILPGLTQVGRAVVETVSLDQLLDDLGLRAEGDHWLVIDAPGEEAEILTQLENSAHLHGFSHIFLRAGAEVLYQGAETASALVQRLEAQGYSATGRHDGSDCDWPRYHFALDRLALECRRLGEQLEHAQAQSRYEAERANAMTTEREQLREQLKQAGAQLVKAQTDLSLALRLQMQRENDLKELQTRYGELLTIKDEQQDLLTQLHHRLSRAAEYLQLVHAQSDDQRLPDELLEALTGKGESSR